MTVQPLPIASHAPAGAKPGHESVPSPGLNTQRHLVAEGTTIAIREDEEEHDRCHDDTQHEEGDENNGKDHGTTPSIRL